MKPLLCYVTDRRALADPSRLVEHIALVISAGIDWIQIREKDLSGRELLALTRAAVDQAPPERRDSCRIIVNDRLDVALAAGAGGVHFGESALPISSVAGWRREASEKDDSFNNFLIGASCHSIESVRAAERDGADYVIFGPVFPTPSKEKFGAPQGINRLAEASKAVKIPVLAVGGITEQNARECFGAGAAGVTAIRMFSGEHDLAAVIGRLRTAR